VPELLSEISVQHRSRSADLGVPTQDYKFYGAEGARELSLGRSAAESINRILIDKYETLLSQLSRLQPQDCTADYFRGQLNRLAFALAVTGHSGHLPKRG
jgi:hypothetical protein